MPPAVGVLDDLDLRLLDPGDEDQRRLLIVAEHPELQAALDADVDHVTVDSGTFNPRMHIAMHEVVANQLWDDNPPEMWMTAQRLAALGYNRHDVLHMLANVVTRDIFQALRGQPASHERTVRALQQLPDALDDEERFTGNRAARRAARRTRH